MAAKHTVFRAGEVHGRITPRAEEVCRLVAYSDSAKTTDNLWGERWSKLVANVMGNGLSACTGLSGGDVMRNDALRRFSTRLGSEAIRVGQALGYALVDIQRMKPETIARAGEGDADATRAYDDNRREYASHTADEQRPSMGQDMQKGRRTEIQYLNGLVAREGEKLGLACPANTALTDIVTARRARRTRPRPPPHHRAALELTGASAGNEKGPAPGPFLHSRVASAAYHLFLMLTEMMSALWSALPMIVRAPVRLVRSNRRIVEEDVRVGEVERHLLDHRYVKPPLTHQRSLSGT